MKLKILFALGGAALMAATPANAATITYTFTGDFSGTLAGNPFTTSATFTGVGDTNTLSAPNAPNPGPRFVNLTSLTAVAGGTTYTITSTAQFFLNAFDYAGLFFGSAGNGGGSFAGTGPGLVGYDPTTSLPTTQLTLTGVGPVFFTTDRGDVTIDGFQNGTFGAVVSGAVPEPATWAMMIMGFGATGAAMRRRKQAVRVTYA